MRIFYKIITLHFFISISVFGQYNANAIKQYRLQLKDSHDSITGKLYNKLFVEFYSHSAFDSATAIAIEAIEKGKNINDKKLESTAMIWQGMVEFEKGNYDKTVNFYLQALKIKEEIHDVKGQSSVLINLGGVYYDRNNFVKATEIYRKALVLKVKLNDKKGQASICQNLGNIAQTQQKLDEAAMYYNQGKRLAQEAGDTIQVATNNRALANVYLGLHKIADAEKLANAAYAVLRKYNNRHYIQCLTLLGKIYIEKGNYDLSLHYLSEAYNQSIENSTPFLTKEVCLVLVRVYQKLNQLDMCLLYQKKYSQINDSLQNAKLGEQLAEMQIKYETEKKEKAIEHLDKENNKKELQLARKENQLLIISGVSLFILLSLLALYFYNNAKIHKEVVLKEKELNQVKQQRHKEIVETIITTEEKERKKIASDLHDGLGQILTAAKINLSNTLSNSADEERFKNVSELINSAISESKATALNLMPLTLKENGLTDSIKNICAKYNKPSIQEISFNSYNIPDKLESIVEVNTYRICQELLNNAVKYSKASKIFLQLFCRDNKLIIQIEDNGIGFDKSKIKQDGLGMNTLKERVALLEGEIEIDTAPQKGTNIFIELAL